MKWSSEIMNSMHGLVAVSTQGFKDSVNISLFGLAIADFGALITLVWMAVCFTPWFRFSDIPFESTDVQYPTAGRPGFWGEMREGDWIQQVLYWQELSFEI